MQRVGSREFRNHIGRYMQAIRKGQSFLITDRGTPVAKISPPDQDANLELTFSDVLKRLEAEGKIRLATRPLVKFKAVPIRGKSASERIIEDRR